MLKLLAGKMIKGNCISKKNFLNSAICIKKCQFSSSNVHKMTLELLQQNQTYQKALELAHQKKFKLTLEHLERTMDEMTE